MIIGLVGQRRSGKDTAAQALIECGFEPVKFAEGLKVMLRSLFSSLGANETDVERMIEGDLKEQPSHLLGGKTPRFAMQSLGTNWGRELIGDNIWVDTAIERCRRFVNAVITDCRFPNEAAAIKLAGGKLIRITRPGSLPSEPTPFFANKSDLYYAAGLIEGEGYFKALPRSREKSGAAPEVAIRIQMADRQPLDRLVATIGGRITGPYKSRRRNTKPLFSWNLQRRAEVVAVVHALMPMLSPRRAAAAQKILDADAAFPRGSHCNYSHVSEQVDKLEVDAEIENSGSISDLHVNIRRVITSFGRKP